MDKEMSGHIKSTVIMAFVLVASCKDNYGLVTPTPPVIVDQGDCVAACANLQRLNCDEGKPIDMGQACVVQADCLNPIGQKRDVTQACVTGRCITDCTNFCVQTENQGVWLDPTCVKSITSCSQVDSCPTPTKPSPSCVGPACNIPGNQ